MDAMQIRTFNALVEHFLGVRVPERLAGQISYPCLPLEARHFTLRMLSLMQRASYPASDFTPLLIRALSTTAGATLPCAWDGRIPPITMAGRHRKLDTFVDRQPWPRSEDRPVFIDLGCGFPPATTLDTSRYLPEWNIIGVDREFAFYVLYDRDGHYACFDYHGNLLYLQTHLNASGSALTDDPKSTRNLFKSFFDSMLPMLPTGDATDIATVEQNGNQLIRNPIRDYEADNLTFIQADILKLDLFPAQVIRCMNVLLYFNAQERKELLFAIGRLLDDGGLLIAGFNHFLGSGARYVIYRKSGKKLVPGEFTFSLDNLRPVGIAPWYTLYEDDPEAGFLADLTAAIRDDATFWRAFNQRVDDLLDVHGICRRSSDGFLQFPEPLSSPELFIDKLVALWQQIDTEGFATDAVEALGRAGYRTWINPVGDIAVEPHKDRFPFIVC